LERIRAQEGDGVDRMNLMLCDGEHLVAVHRSGQMGLRVVKGRPDLERLLGTDALRRIRIPDMASCRFCLIAADFDDEPSGWTAVPMDAIVTVTRTDDPTTECL
jgi:hypothetical protein